jgi:hypothetical protein
LEISVCGILNGIRLGSGEIDTRWMPASIAASFVVKLRFGKGRKTGTAT